MTRELMTLGDSQSKALELADGSYGHGKRGATNLVVRECMLDVGWEDLTELMACYIQFNLGTADVALLQLYCRCHQMGRSSAPVSLPATCQVRENEP